MTTSNKILTAKELKRKIAVYRRMGKSIAFTNGCFDILHFGHVSYLETAKKNRARVLIVGMNSDRSVRAQKKGPGRPIVPQKERAQLLAALACVDHVVLFNAATPQKLIEELRPDILIKGADWKGKEVAGSDVVKRVEFIKFVKGRSTTNIVKKIKRL